MPTLAESKRLHGILHLQPGVLLLFDWNICFGEVASSEKC